MSNDNLAPFNWRQGTNSPNNGSQMVGINGQSWPKGTVVKGRSPPFRIGTACRYVTPVARSAGFSNNSRNLDFHVKWLVSDIEIG